ncbi:MAG: BlaI/MecI/CopY family transcriptional regulator, partial [Solirubrobacterales bacterium]|nr:BlaI/MecI/CopY family transcriptional regulator [Solirubrobacterales bacterium]
LLGRERQGRAYTYRASQDEADFLSGAIGDRLAEASPGARRSVLINLLGDLQPEDLDEVARYTRRIRRARTDEP